MSTSKLATQIRRDQIARGALELIASEIMKGSNAAGQVERAWPVFLDAIRAQCLKRET